MTRSFGTTYMKTMNTLGNSPVQLKKCLVRNITNYDRYGNLKYVFGPMLR